MSSPLPHGASRAVASVNQLPHTGTGGAAGPGVSVAFLLVMGVIAGISGIVLALAGRAREVEDDGVTYT